MTRIKLVLGFLLLLVPQTAAIMGGLLESSNKVFYGVIWTLVWFVGLILFIKGTHE